jgi:ferrochelatase
LEVAVSRWGVLLINLGTPRSTDTSDVRRYLREFLSDPRVLDINPVGRFFLLNLVILPRRPAQSAEAYEKIWTDQGSPLLVYGEALAQGVAERLRGEVPVELAMRYQDPSIGQALARLRERDVDQIAVVPLFPQYASAATGSALEALYREAATAWNVPNLVVVPPYFDHPAFIDAFAQVARPVLEDFEPEHLIMSFHGLPERHVVKSDESESGHCLRSEDCCQQMVSANRNCYRAQCFATARALAAQLDLEADAWEVAFQSRLGRDPWIRPFTDQRVIALATSGVKRLAVLCPSFVADCLETLEEIGLRAAEDFQAHGGDELILVPSLNAEPVWVDAIVQLLAETFAPATQLLAERAGGTISPESPLADQVLGQD